MPTVLPIDPFLAAAAPMLDVRSPAEYEQGHIPGAISFPLFSDAERAIVGTCYKQQGRDQAVELGLTIVGPKLAQFVQQAKQLAPQREFRIHCWRGGMRSGSMAWLMETAGFRVSVLENGYKGFRRWVRETLAVPKFILTLSGMTGTGKTAVLHQLAQQGEQILDLEALANHRGSSYGALGLPPQPTTEQFENLIAVNWTHLDRDRPVWIEAESRMIGTCRIPDELFRQMLVASALQLERSRSERVALLLEVYGAAAPDDLIAATERLTRRLGGQHAKQAIEDIRRGNLASAIELVLDYYDKSYRHDLQRRTGLVYSVDVTGCSIAECAQTVITAAKRFDNQSGSLTNALSSHPASAIPDRQKPQAALEHPLKLPH